MNALLLRTRRLLAPGLLLALASCNEGAPLEPAAAPSLSTSGTTAPLECPVEVTKSVSKTIDLLGGTLELDGHRLSIPLNAVLLPTQFTLTVPASNYMEIKVTAGNQEHFDFRAPVSLTIDYSRCTRSNINKSALRIYYWDSATKVFLQDMGGTDDKAGRKVTTTTDHLSDYVIGQNQTVN